MGLGPSPPTAGTSLGPGPAGGSRPRCPPAHGARSPPTWPRGPRARSQLTGRWRLDRPTGWGARRGRRAVLKLWAGTVRPPSSPLGGAEPPPHVPLLPRSCLPGRDVRSRESGVGGTAGGGGRHWRERGALGAPPDPARLPAPLGQVWGGVRRAVGERASSGKLPGARSRPSLRSHFRFPARSPLLPFSLPLAKG